MRAILVAFALLTMACFVACGGAGKDGHSGPGESADGESVNAEPDAERMARSKWKAKIAVAKAAFDREVSDAAAAVKRAEADLELAKKSPPPSEYSKKVKECEDNVRRAKDAVEFAAKRDSEYNKREAKSLLERREKELAEARSLHIAKAAEVLRSAKSVAPVFAEPRFPPDSLQVGDVAKLGSGPGKVSLFTVFQLVDGHNALIMYGNDHLFWGEFNTSGLADKDVVKLEGLVECVGTRQYRTPLGTTKTVRVLRQY